VQAVIRFVLALAAAAAPAVPAFATPKVPQVRITLKPVAIDTAAGTGALDVTLVFPAMQVPAGEALLTHQGGAPGMSRGIPLKDMTVRDGSGTVAITQGGQGAPGWTANRAVKGELTVHYVVQIDNSSGGILSSIPHVDGYGMFGIGNMLLTLPKTEARYRIAIDWDLSAMRKGSTAVSSFGDGDVSLPAGRLSRLTYAMFMAGDIQRERQGAKTGFSAVWTGDPKFDVRGAMRWTKQLYSFMSKFFADPAEPLYHVFLRENPFNPGNGVAAPHAFALGFGPATTAEGAKTILGHEMTHTWTANDLGKWYSEGNAVFYQQQLPWRAGMVPIERYLRDINLTAARYFTNSAIAAPDSDIVPRFWDDQRYSVLPYDRGAIYFAILNGKIKRKTGGKQSIDDLIRAMVARTRDDQPITEDIWLDELRKALGEEGPALHQAMMTGKTLVPESGDYGPCFRRVDAKIRRFDLGFGPAQLKRQTVVQGLRPGSEAEKAGLKEGDMVDYRTSTDGALRDPEATLTMKVTRDGKTFSVTYLPRGEAIDAYQWERVADMPESACR
jgi:predicted metalloprotease with PDZ domain